MQDMALQNQLHNAFHSQVTSFCVFPIINRLLCIIRCLLFPYFLTVSRYDIRYDHIPIRLENEEYPSYH